MFKTVNHKNSFVKPCVCSFLNSLLKKADQQSMLTSQGVVGKNEIVADIAEYTREKYGKEVAVDVKRGLSKALKGVKPFRARTRKYIKLEIKK